MSCLVCIGCSIWVNLVNYRATRIGAKSEAQESAECSQHLATLKIEGEWPRATLKKWKEIQNDE